MKKKEKPSILKMVSNFVKESVKFIKEGAPICSEEEYTERITLCYECDKFDSDKKVCELCGCFMPAKAGWKTSFCPDDPPKWKRLMSEKQEEIEKEKRNAQMPSQHRAVADAKQEEIRIQRKHIEQLRRQARINGKG